MSISRRCPDDVSQAADLRSLVSTYHRYMEELFWLHQEAMLVAELPLAIEFWGLHRQMLGSHIDLENRHLLSVLERVEQPRWRAEVYRLEHAKILDLADTVTQRLVKLEAGRVTRRGIIAMLDHQRSLKNVLEHHDQREEQGILPELHRVLSEPELSGLVAVCTEQWGALLRAQQSVVSRLRKQLPGEAQG